MMASRVASAPLPRALEYLASLPDYYPVPMDGLLDMDYRGEHHVTVRPPNDEQSKRARAGKRAGKPSRPSKFIPGKLKYGQDFGCINKILVTILVKFIFLLHVNMNHR